MGIMASPPKVSLQWFQLLLIFLLQLALGTPPPNKGPAAAVGLAQRVLGVDVAALFSFEPLNPETESWCNPALGPCAMVQNSASDNGTIQISGSSPVEMAYALAQYCQRELLMSFAWERSGGFQVAAADRLTNMSSNLAPPALPRLQNPIRLQKRCASGQGQGSNGSGCYTHYGNVVTSSYSWWNWGWARWEREIDWMALHGVNLVFAFTGQEYVYRETFRDLGLDDMAIQSSFNGPAFLGWSRSYESAWENGATFWPNGSLNTALPEDFLTGQWELQKQIVARQVELGIGSVLPAFSGKVPGQLKTVFPSSNITGDGSPGPAWVEGLDPLFTNISRLFLEKQIRDFGRTGFYEADGFFGTHAAPWKQIPTTQTTGTTHTHQEYQSVTHLTSDSSSGQGMGTTHCVFGPQINNHYVPGEASDNGKTYASLDSAQAVCQSDVFCGGVESRHCNGNGTNCTQFQTRSGMSSKGCHAGVPCPGDIPKAVPVPAGAEIQNAFLITNAPQCGHHPPPPPPEYGGDARAHAEAVYKSMRDIDEEAVWIYQGWPWMRTFIPSYSTCDSAQGPDQQGIDYMRNFSSAVPRGKLVFLDMRSECASVAALTDGFFNSSFVWESMDNFGGGNGMYGDLSLVLEKMDSVSSAAENGSATAESLAGTGISMEGIDQNPLYYETILDGLWSDVAVHTVDDVVNITYTPRKSATELAQDWGARRCGKSYPEVTEAWALLANTSFRAGQGVSLHHAYCGNYFPSASKSQSWSSDVNSPGFFWRGGYSTDVEAAQYSKALFKAWQLLTESAAKCNTASARFDVVDVGREWLQTVPCVSALRTLASSWTQRSKTNASLAGEMLRDVMTDLDTLLSADAGFSFGAWIASARNLSNDTSGRDQLELNARAQVTSWAVYPYPAQPWSHAQVAAGEFAGINDYAIKQWGGLTREYQAVRMELLGDQVEADISSGSAELNLTNYVAAVKRYMVSWLRAEWNSTDLPVVAVGDPVQISLELQRKYGFLLQ